MKRQTFIVLIPVKDSLVEPRKSCEFIENTSFTSEKPLFAYQILGKVMNELGISEGHNIEVEPITDFMDRVNNEEFNPNVYFMSYVHNEHK